MDETEKSTIQKTRNMNADSKETSKNVKLQIHMCNALHNRE